MPWITRYILGQLVMATVFITLALTFAIWLTQSLRLIDYIVNRGLPASTFLTFIGLICSECKNRRFIKSQQGVRLCPTCGGKPGPKLSQQELLYQLRLESSLLHGVQRSWIAQTVVDGGAPLRDLDPDELAATYRIDPARTRWRNGAWESPPTAPSSPAKPESGR
jgi:hypothetical protein